ALLERLSTLPEADEVAGSGDWVERLSQWQRLLTTIGLGIGVVLAAAAFLTVTTATTLILHARRAETEIMRLVGATETTIWLPLLLQGTMQGLIGAVLALAALVATHSVVAPALALASSCCSSCSWRWRGRSRGSKSATRRCRASRRSSSRRKSA